MRQPIGSEALKQRSTDGGGHIDMPTKTPAEKIPQMTKAAMLQMSVGGRLKTSGWGAEARDGTGAMDDYSCRGWHNRLAVEDR